MNDKELKSVRKKFKLLKNNSEETKLAINELEKLEQEPQVKRYLELKKIVETNDVEDDKTLASRVFSSYLLKTTKDSYKIYVYIGTISGIDEENDYVFVKESSLEAKINFYRDLETEETIEVPISDVSIFERNNRIVRFGTSLRCQNEKKFYELQQKFYLELIHNSPARTISKTLHLHL